MLLLMQLSPPAPRRGEEILLVAWIGARSDQQLFMQALNLEQVIADSASMSCLIGDFRDSASVLTRIRGYVGRVVMAAAPQMATINRDLWIIIPSGE